MPGIFKTNRVRKMAKGNLKHHSQWSEGGSSVGVSSTKGPAEPQASRLWRMAIAGHHFSKDAYFLVRVSKCQVCLMGNLTSSKVLKKIHNVTKIRSWKPGMATQ